MYLLALLTQASRSYEEIMDFMKRVPIQFGALSFLHDSTMDFGFMGKTKSAFNDLIEKRLISKDETGQYHLTDEGRPLGESYAKRMSKVFNVLSVSTTPSLSPTLSFLIHLILGTIKITGFFLISSISLLGDGLDSLLDGVSSIIVVVAMKIKKEVAATLTLLFLMLITGLGILGQSITRLLKPVPLEEELLAVFIACISIILCVLLYFYQRYSGYRNRSLAILTQSEDSKNHVLNALLVLVAVLAGIFRIYWVDGIVGCFIGFIILRGAYEIFMDLRATNKGEKVDFEKYKLGAHVRYEKVQDTQLESWILWITVDVISTNIYAMKGLYFTAGLYGLFLILATMGLVKWYKSMKKHKASS